MSLTNFSSDRLLFNLLLLQTHQYLLFLQQKKQFSLSKESLKLLDLTKRESEILFWCFKGKNNQEISQLLFISDKTVKKHLEKIYVKLGVSSRSAAITSALEKLGIIS
jgi:DNA-binding CsgD family transcriptional regulator